MLSLLLQLPPPNFDVLIYVIGFPDPSIDDPSSCTILLPNSNSNGNPFADFGLLGGTCSYAGLNSSKVSCVTILSVYNSVAYKPFHVYCCVANAIVNVKNVLDL